MKLRALALLAAAVTLAGCGSDEPEEGPLIEYSRSGGIAFTAQALEVERDGRATLTLEQAGKPDTSAIELGEEELASLTDAVDAIDPGAVEVDSEVACADCYVYALGFPGGTELEFAEFPAPPAELEPLLTQLDAMVEEHSPPNPAGA